MQPLTQVAIGIFAIAAIVVSVKLFSAPLKWAAKTALSTALGFACLIFFNLAGGMTGITLGVNLANSLVIGILGLPGFAVLLCLKWIFH